jgi:hypothetical protein
MAETVATIGGGSRLGGHAAGRTSAGRQLGLGDRYWKLSAPRFTNPGQKWEADAGSCTHSALPGLDTTRHSGEINAD